MARLHRQTEARHLTSARIHQLHAIRMERWLLDPGTLRPVFMAAVASTLGIDGATATLRGHQHRVAAVTASDDIALAAHDLEVVLGEGPAATAMADGVPVVAAGDSLLDRWPSYGPAVAELGVRAVIAAPMRVPAGCFGALCVYDGKPVISRDAAAVTERIAAAVTHVILRSEVDGLADVFDCGTDAIVNQAIGMIAAYRECGALDAETLLRARAFAASRGLRDIALDVVEGRTRLG